MSTPRERIEWHARHHAFVTQLMVNKLDAAALVAMDGSCPCGEEEFLSVARMAYQSAKDRIKDSTAHYLDKLLPPELRGQPATHPVQPSDGKGEGS